MDRRTQIIDRLLDLLGSLSIPLLGDPLSGPSVLSGADELYHNRGELPGSPDPKVPGIILLDADEVKDPRFVMVQGRNLAAGTQVMRMTPEIYIVLPVRKPRNVNVGTDLNTARAAILDLVLHDKALSTITGPNGGITYDGCVTDMARNRTMKGQMGLSFTFSYPLIPGELVGFNSPD